MQLLKDTQRAQVARDFTGAISKTFFGPRCQERFRNELRILNYLNAQNCPFVPKVLAFDRNRLNITLSYAGEPVQRISAERMDEIFAELQDFGVRHEDPAPRNILYSHALGRFTLIDFEFAVLVDEQNDQMNEQTSEPHEEPVEYNRFDEIDHTFDELDAMIDSVSS